MAEIFTCTVCGQEFTDENQLKDHMTNVHTIKEEKPDEEVQSPAHNPLTGQGGE
jgi:hypothetical protein